MAATKVMPSVMIHSTYLRVDLTQAEISSLFSQLASLIEAALLRTGVCLHSNQFRTDLIAPTVGPIIHDSITAQLPGISQWWLFRDAFHRLLDFVIIGQLARHKSRPCLLPINTGGLLVHSISPPSSPQKNKIV